MLDLLKKSLEKEYYQVTLNSVELDGKIFNQLIVSIVFQDHPQIPNLELYIMFLPDVEKELNSLYSNDPNNIIFSFFNLEEKDGRK